MDKITKYLTNGAMFLLLYWLITKCFDVYRFIITGAIYEMTALLAVLAVYLVLLFSIINMFKKRTAAAFIPLIVSVVTLLVMYFMPFIYTVKPL